jgi:glycosyltransferase involved in cell wall biosynthesis
MPLYNAAQTCDEALASVLQQSLSDLEVIAVDDGSEDDTLDRLRQWSQRDRRVKPLPISHGGLIEALNHGLGLCTGQYVARMDADDRCHRERLSMQCEHLDRNPEVSVIGSLVEAFPPHDLRQGFQLYIEWLNGLLDHEAISREIFIESPIAHPSAMVRRHELVELGGYQEQGWAEDYDLWLRYHAAGKRFAKINRVLLYWREHEHRLTRTDSRYSVENFLRAKAHYLCAGLLRSRGDLVIWGAGHTGRRISKHLERGGCPPRCFVDIAPQRTGGSLRRVPVIAPAQLADQWPQLHRPVLLVAVASRRARQLIRAHLIGTGMHETVDYYCVA